MSERFIFVGPGITAKDDSRAAYDMARVRKVENAFQSAELPKTPGELAAIDLLDDLLKREFRDLGVSVMPEIRPERFHIMSDEWFEQSMPRKDTKGSYSSYRDKAVLSRSRTGSTLQLYKTIFHEGVHAASQSKHWFDVVGRKLSDYRLGYLSRNRAKPGEGHEHFRAFNEGVVETTVQELFVINGKEAQQKLGVSQDDMQKVKFSYQRFRDTVRSICEGLASKNGGEAYDYWKKIKRGQFTGEMMHLRDIEIAYGKGALRVLDSLSLEPNGDTEEAVMQEIDRKNMLVLQYFESYDRAEEGEDRLRRRWELAREILGEAMFDKYCVEE